MDSIYHEKQDGALCAQHCLNNLLQNSYFTAVDLADIARQLDSIENHLNSEATKDSENMDDTGMFSIQVISQALEPFSLNLVNLESQEPSAKTAKANPVDCKAFVCNYEHHWLAVRRFGCQWFNLDSLLGHPEVITDLYLSMYLHQLSVEGYSIFLVEGSLPNCVADQLLQLYPMELLPPDLAEQLEDSEPEDDDELQAAIALSLTQDGAQEDKRTSEETQNT